MLSLFPPVIVSKFGDGHLVSGATGVAALAAAAAITARALVPCPVAPDHCWGVITRRRLWRTAVNTSHA